MSKDAAIAIFGGPVGVGVVAAGKGPDAQKKKKKAQDAKKQARRDVTQARKEAATDRFGRSLLDDGSSSLLGGRPGSVSLLG